LQAKTLLQVKKIPVWLRLNLNLCQDINDKNLVNHIKDILDQASCRILEALEENCDSKLEQFEVEFETIKLKTFERFGDRAGKKLVLDAKKHIFDVTKHVKDDHKRKVDKLKNEEVDLFVESFGSRKVFGWNYGSAKGCICSNEAEPTPYVRQLRVHRRNRKHKRVIKEKSDYIRTEEDLKRLNPVVLTDNSPVDVFDQALDTHEWAERLRWRYFWNKDKSKEEIEKPFQKNPWYQSKGNSAPKNCKALEAFIEAYSRKYLGPKNRKRIKSNLSPEMKRSMKKLKNIPVTHGVGVRYADKSGKTKFD
jgi:hypothetical protein